MTSIKDLDKKLREAGLSVHGSKRVMVERLTKKAKPKKVTVALLQELCRCYKLKMLKSYSELCSILKENNVHWSFNTETGELRHSKIVQPIEETYSDGTAKCTYEPALAMECETEDGALDYMDYMDSLADVQELSSLQGGLDLDSEHSALDMDKVPEVLRIEPAVDLELKMELALFHDDNEIKQPLIDDPNCNATYEVEHVDYSNGTAEDGETIETSDEREGLSTDIDQLIEKSVNSWHCFLCGYGSKHKFSVRRHIYAKHTVRERIKCEVCSKELFRECYLSHQEYGHIDVSRLKNVIMKGEDNDFVLNDFCCDTQDIKKLYQLVGIPWANAEGEIVQISIGITKSAEVSLYAKKIWQEVLRGLKTKGLRVVGCGSAVNAAAYHNIVMVPNQAFPFDLFMYEMTVGNKVKGFCREGLDSIRHIAANDSGDRLRGVKKHIMRKLVKVNAEGKIPARNWETFTEPCEGNLRLSLLNRRRFNVKFINEMLTSLDDEM